MPKAKLRHVAINCEDLEGEANFMKSAFELEEVLDLQRDRRVLEDKLRSSCESIECHFGHSARKSRHLL